MVTRETRLAEFQTDSPLVGATVDVLCEDHNGTYTLPFPCKWNGTDWVNVKSGHLVEATVVGWREW